MNFSIRSKGSKNTNLEHRTVWRTEPGASSGDSGKACRRKPYASVQGSAPERLPALYRYFDLRRRNIKEIAERSIEMVRSSVPATVGFELEAPPDLPQGANADGDMPGEMRRALAALGCAPADLAKAGPALARVVVPPGQVPDHQVERDRHEQARD